MKKKRHNPDKPQNKYGGDYDCINYDESNTGREFCHDEGQAGWNEWIKWCKENPDTTLKCKGNRHNCNKLRLQWLASLSEEKRNKINK